MRYAKVLWWSSLLLVATIILQQSTPVFAQAGARLVPGKFAVFLSNGEIKLSLDRNDGTIRGIDYGPHALSSREGFFAYSIYPLPPQRYGGDNRGRPLREAGQKVSIGRSRNTARGIIVPLSWDTAAAKIQEELFLPNRGSYFRIHFKVELKKGASEIAFASANIGGLSKEGTLFYPEKERLGWRKYALVPAYSVAYDRSDKIGLGVLAPGRGDIGTLSKQLVYKPMTDSVSGIKTALWVRKIEKGKRDYEGTFAVFLLSRIEDLPGIWEQADPASFAARKRVSLVKVFPNKLIYNNNEEGKIEVTVVNNSAKMQAAVLECTLVRRINSKEKIGRKKITLAPMESKKVTFSFNTGAQEYGVAAQVGVFLSGKLEDKRSGYFTVGTHWAKFYDYCITYPSRLSYSKEGIPWKVYQERDSYITAAHIFAWYPVLGNLAPKENWYMSEQRILKSGKAILRFTKAAKKLGIKTNFYYAIQDETVPGSLDYAADPTKIVYNKYGQPNLQTLKLSDKETVIAPWANHYAPYFRDWLAGEIVKSIAMFGWDSLFFDNVGTLGKPKPGWSSFYHLYTYEGKMAGKVLGKTPEEAAPRWMKALEKKVREKYPNFLFAGNLIGPGKGFMATTSNANLPFYRTFDMVMAELGGGGVQLAQRQGVGIWKNLKATFDGDAQGSRRAGLNKVNLFIYGPFNYAGDVGTKGYLALAFANNLHVGSWWPAPAYSYFGRPMMEYYKFRIRYNAYLYDSHIRWIPPEKVNFVKVDAPPRVYWKEYVYEKPTPAGKEFLLHFVNMSPAKYFWRRNEPPLKRENIKVRMNLPEGYPGLKVYLLSPDLGYNARELKVRRQGGEIEFTLPSLEYYDLVVVKPGG